MKPENAAAADQARLKIKAWIPEQTYLIKKVMLQTCKFSLMQRPN